MKSSGCLKLPDSIHLSCQDWCKKVFQEKNVFKSSLVPIIRSSLTIEIQPYCDSFCFGWQYDNQVKNLSKCVKSLKPLSKQDTLINMCFNFFSVELYMSPVETWCHNINYYIPDEEGATKDFSQENMTRIRKWKS